MSNILKYALPGTRVYLELTGDESGAAVIFRNTSRTEIVQSAEELTERFVRGDASRSSEGSGLGLSIARSLAELQGGSLEVTVDGDLFKVTLGFAK
jgi:signal transduction histidine kinase